MREGDFYHHFKKAEYYFCGIAHPITDGVDRSLLQYPSVAIHHETGDEMKLYSHNGVMFIESEDPFVIYQSEKDYNTEKVYAREVDSFFGYKIHPDGQAERRFALKER